MYSPEPANKHQFTKTFDHTYTKFATIYDWIVKRLPIWRNWITQAIPHIRGNRVLEISFGTGYLMSRYAERYETYGIDYNEKMTQLTKKNLALNQVDAQLQRANVEALPYADGIFDSVVNTMSFTGYPDGQMAMAEIHRVLKAGGRLILIDINYPKDGNRLGTMMARSWASLGDILRNMHQLFEAFGFAYFDQEIGGFGSIHLYVATKK